MSRLKVLRRPYRKTNARYNASNITRVCIEHNNYLELEFELYKNLEYINIWTNQNSSNFLRWPLDRLSGPLFTKR